MSTIQIGTRLAREFGNGSNLKKVITEVLDGKVYTKVLNKDGKVVKERVKAFAEKNIGDKFVKTTTKVVKDDELGKLVIQKNVIDRVYDAGHRALGLRSTNYCRDAIDDSWIKNRVIKKSNITGKKTITDYLSDRIRCLKYVTCDDGYVTVSYNEKGLPMPEWAKTINHNAADYKNLCDKSLKDMLTYHFEKKPYLKYLPDEAGLPTLNNRFAHTPKLSDLDKYI